MNEIKYETDLIYSKSVHGDILTWKSKVTIENDKIYIVTLLGSVNGVRTVKKEIIHGKNIGKRNATSPLQQAIVEVKRKYKKKLTSGYTTDESKATIDKSDFNNILKPMKAVMFRRGLMNYPAILQVKINGVRCSSNTVEANKDLFSNMKDNVKLLTKDGLEYLMPNISSELDSLLKKYYDINFDGELYKHNEILSEIRKRIPYIKSNGTVVRNSLPSEPVMFMIFDLNIKGYPQLIRLQLKDEILNKYNSVTFDVLSKRYIFNIVNPKSKIVNIQHILVHSDDEVYEHLEYALASNFEGVIVRDIDAEYMFGGRRINMSKLKGDKSSEFEILDIVLKNKDSNRTYISFIMKNDLNDKVFECTPNGNEEDRLEFLNNKYSYIGNLATITFGERTVKGLPFHIKSVVVRKDFDLDINDLNIEI